MNTETYSPLSFEQLTDLDPNFAVWLKLVDALGQLPLCVSYLLKQGLVKNEKEGIEYLNRVVSVAQKSKSVLSFRDFTRIPKNSTSKLNKLDKEQNHQIFNAGDFRWHGVLGHHLVAKIENNDLEIQKETFKQPPLFCEKSNWQKTKLKDFNLSSVNILLRPGIGVIEDHIKEELLTILQELKEITALPEIWLKNFEQSEKLFQKLCQNLPPIFQPYISRLVKNNGSSSRYLNSLTVQTWARALLAHNQYSPRVILPEIGLIPFDVGIIGGRIDGIEIVKVRGHAPNHRERKDIKDIYLSTKSKTFKNLLPELYRKFSDDLEFEIIERKFAIGDGTKKSPILSQEDVSTSPVLIHQQQIRAYLTLFGMENYFLNQKRGDYHSIWKNSLKGQISYYLPWTSPQVHKILMEKEDQERFFKEIVVYNWQKGKNIASLRGITNIVVNHINHLEKIGKTEIKKAKTKNQNQFSFSFESPLKKNSLPHLSEIVNSYQEFLDQETKIFVVVNNDKQFIIDVEQLATALKRKLIKTSHFSFPRGGLISCPMHNDSTPSLYVYLESGHYHCFSCGRHGELTGISWLGQPLIFSSQYIPVKIKDIVISSKHAEIMERAHYHLQKSFFRSPGEEYIRKTRRLDPKIAFYYGVGFDDNELILRLLEDGYNFEEIVKYGFISFSSFITSDDPFIKKLQKAIGLSDSMKLEAHYFDQCQKGNTGLPFDILQHRVTFPLKLFGKFSNFYGRHVFAKDKKRIHRKLSTKFTKMPTGAFNLNVLADMPEKVIITEGVMDALSIIEGLNEENVIAIIGTDNIGSIDVISSVIKKLAIALDNDSAGQEKTINIYERLRKQGFLGEIENFTETFWETHPVAKNCHDFNEWWQKEKTKK